MAPETKNEQQSQDQRGSRRTMIGVVTSDKMQKTRIVIVTHRVKHEAYKKFVTKRVKYKAHDEKNETRSGDKVLMVESRPLSREKRWRIEKLLERPEQA